MLLAALMLALISGQAVPAGDAACSNPTYPARLAAASSREGSAFLVRASRGGDAQTLSCAEALAIKHGADAPWMEQRDFKAARAAVALRRNDPAAAIALLEPMVGFLHHTVGIPADFHALLSEAYDKAGRYDEAEGQRRMALAAMTDEPPFALSADEIGSLTARDPSFGLLPASPPNPDQVFLDMGSIRVEGPVRRYDTILLLAQEENGAAAVRVQRRIDCQTRRGEVLKVVRLRGDGATLEEVIPEDQREDFSAVISHRQRVICLAEPNAKAAEADVVAALTLFRARQGSAT